MTLLPVVICRLIASTAAARASDSIRLDFDFTLSDHGFSAGFSDYPEDADLSLYSLTNAWMAGPANLGGEPALFISGINRSDDLFMFWKKQITGLPTNAPFLLTMELELASKYAEGLVGVGGAPGEGVTVKAGSAMAEPQPLVDRLEGWWRMNLDKGNQAIGGTNMFAIGKVAKPPDGNVDYVF